MSNNSFTTRFAGVTETRRFFISLALCLCASVVGTSVAEEEAKPQSEKPYQALVENSPFLTPAFKARLGKRDNVALMFVGYTKIGEAWHFAVVDRKSGKSTWMRMDVDYEGVMIEKFDEAAQTIHLTVGGLGVELTLVKE